MHFISAVLICVLKRPAVLLSHSVTMDVRRYRSCSDWR